MQSQIFTYVLLAGLAIALLWVIVTDLKSRTISNHLTLTVAAGAPLYWLAIGLPLWPGIAWQLGLAALVFAICCALFAMRQMGGGDVKLLTALALWVPPSQFTMLVVAMAMLGWVLTMAVGAWRVAHSTTIQTHPARDTIFLIIGTIIAALFASARLWDDGIIDPRDTRRVLTFCLETCLTGRRRVLRPNSFGVARG